MIQLAKELYAYREMIFSLVRRDLKGRYKGSVLGFFWTFLNPLLQLCVYTIVFSIILRNNIEDFYLFLFVALVPWLFFSASVSDGSACVRSQQDMVKKIYFPREVLPIAFTTGQFVNMLLSFCVVLVVLIISGKGINPAALLYLPLIMVIEYLLALGMVMIVAGICVYVRDVQYFLQIIIMAWQFLTPIMYDISIVPEELMPIFNINPMTPIVLAYRDILYYKQPPHLNTLLHATIFGIGLIVVGFYVFGKMKRHFVEEL